VDASEAHGTIDWTMTFPNGALGRMGVESTAQYVIRPDGHVGFRCGGADLTGASRYLHEWFMPASR
jgi:hypothetical protein